MTSRHRLLPVFLLLAATLIACSTTQPRPGGPDSPHQITVAAPGTERPDEASSVRRLLPLEPSIRAGSFDNGLSYFIRPHGEPKARAELRLVVDVGSVLEDEDQLGVAHFLEHMCFNGTENFAKQEIVEYLESIGLRFGPDLNAYTSFDETVYMLQIPTDDPEIVETAFEILGEWAHRVSLEGEEIEKERGVVIEEWRSGRGAQARVFDAQAPTLFKDSRYADRLPIADQSSLESISHEAMRRFYREWYRPDLMAVVAVGDFDVDRIEALIEANFQGIQAATDRRPRENFTVPGHDETLYAIATDPELTMTRVGILQKLPPEEQGSEEDYRRNLVHGLYNVMFNQRLNERTRETDAPFLFAFSGTGGYVREMGAYSLGAVVNEGGEERGLEALMTEVERVRRYGFTESELERARSTFIRSMEQTYRERDKVKSGALADELVRHFLVDESAPGIEAELELTRKHVPGITLEEVNQLAGQWLTQANRVVTASSPSKEDLEPPSENVISAILERVSAAGVSPYEDRVADRPLMAAAPPAAEIVASSSIEELGVEEWRLSNGIRVVLKPTDFKNDEILFTAFSPGGHSLVSDADYIPALTAESVMLFGGIGDFDLTELQKLLADKVVGVRPYIAELEEGVGGSASPEDIELMFQLIHLYLTAPRAEAEAFTIVKQKYQGLIENRLAQPEAVYTDTITKIMSQDHLRRRPWDPELLEQMNLDSSYRVYRDRFADTSDFTFVFVGNFNSAELRPLVASYLGSLPATDREESWRDVGVRAPEGVIEETVYRGIEAKSRVSIYFSNAFEWSRQNRFDLSAVAGVLRIRLREVLREDEGGTYGVSVGASTQRIPIASSSFRISFGCDPERVDELAGLVYDEILALQANGPRPSDVAKVQEQERRRRELQLRENGFWLGALESYLWHEQDPREILSYLELVDGLTAEAIQASAKRWIDFDRRVEVVLKPEQQ
jgi:zinc protease